MIRIRYRSVLAPLLAAALAAGCAGMTGSAADEMHQVMGQPLARLIEQWGPPADRRTAAGKRLVTWELGGDGAALSDGGDGAFCNATVQLDDRNVVVGYYWNGNSCDAAGGQL